MLNKRFLSSNLIRTALNIQLGPKITFVFSVSFEHEFRAFAYTLEQPDEHRGMKCVCLRTEENHLQSQNNRWCLETTPLYRCQVDLIDNGDVRNLLLSLTVCRSLPWHTFRIQCIDNSIPKNEVTPNSCFRGS